MKYIIVCGSRCITFYRVLKAYKEIFMNMVSKILVPVDFSKNAANGLRFAVSLAQKTQAELVVLHVTQGEEAGGFLDLLGAMEGAPAVNPPARVPAHRLLQERSLDLYNFVARVVRNPGRLRIKRNVALGNKIERILGAAHEENADLVVLAAQKQSFFASLIARAKLLKLIARMPCAVLIPPSSAESWPRLGTMVSSIFAR